MEEPDNYYQLNFNDEFSDKSAKSFEEFDPEFARIFAFVPFVASKDSCKTLDESDKNVE